MFINLLPELILALLLGVLAGTFTGLAPGIHINLIAALLITALSRFSTTVSPILPLTFIVSMSITHTFLDFIPSIYLGAPNEDTALSILPGHEMLKQGKGHEAVLITLQGSLTAIPIILAISPLFIKALPFIYPSVKTLIPFILIFISLFIIFREEKFTTSLTVFILSGFLGFASLNSPLKDPLLPLLTGLFGTSSLIISFKDKSPLIKQSVTSFKQSLLEKREYFKSIISSVIVAPFLSFLPGLTSSHAATIASEIIPQSKKSFLFLTGTINTIIMGLSFLALYSINKTRSGSAAAIHTLIPALSSSHLILILTTILISGIVAFFLGIYISKIFSKLISKIDYNLISLGTIIFLILVVFLFTSFLGILILATSTALGIFAIASNSKRINLMGSLLIPTILFYLV